MSKVKHYRLDIYESNKSGEFETYADMKESEPSRFTYVKSTDYDALKKDLEIVRDSHRRQGQLNDALTAKLEKAELEVKFVKEYLNPADTSFKQMIDAFRSLPKEKQDKLINLSQSLADFENT